MEKVFLKIISEVRGEENSLGSSLERCLLC